MSDRDDDPMIPPPGGTAAPEGPADPPSTSPETDSLLRLIDKLGALLERTDLVELEVEAGETGIVLRKQAALTPTAPPAAPASGLEAGADASSDEAAAAPATRFVRAPLTGIFYDAPSPTSPPYLSPGQHIAVGQIIGLIEAMKLFNEIKSDQAGRVVRVVAETGKLVKAKQPLVEVEP